MAKTKAIELYIKELAKMFSEADFKDILIWKVRYSHMKI